MNCVSCGQVAVATDGTGQWWCTGHFPYQRKKATPTPFTVEIITGNENEKGIHIKLTYRTEEEIALATDALKKLIDVAKPDSVSAAMVVEGNHE